MDTWSDGGWALEVELEFTEPFLTARRQRYTIQALLNTTPIAKAQRSYDRRGQAPLTVNFEMETSVDQVVLYHIASSHGGRAVGDEFVKRTHAIRIDGEIKAEITPRREDCVAYRRFNPSSGVWTKSVEWAGEVIEERIASSDYSRAGWCPGGKVTPGESIWGLYRRARTSLVFLSPGLK